MSNLTEQSNIEKTLEVRGERYGEFKDVAVTTNSLFLYCTAAQKFHKLNDSQHLALLMICNKIARIVNGDPNYINNWHDIAGYATLIEKELQDGV